MPNENTKETEFLEKVIKLVSDSCHRVLPNEGDIITVDDTYKPTDSKDKWRAGDEFRFTAISRGYRRTYIECVATKFPMLAIMVLGVKLGNKLCSAQVHP